MRLPTRVLAATASAILLAPSGLLTADAAPRGAQRTVLPAVVEVDDPLAAMDAVRPTVVDPPAPVLGDVADGTPPDPESVQQALEPLLDDPWLNDSVSVAVLDVLSDQVVWQHDDQRAVVPASLSKLFSAAATVTTLPLTERLQTRAAIGSQPNQIVLIAGGDTLLAAGHGNENAVIGHAGLADLAEQVAAELEGQADAPQQYTVLLDTTYADGDDRAPGWTDFWLSEGFTGRIVMLGLGQHRSSVGAPAPQDPPAQAAVAFTEALAEAGVPMREQEADQVERLSSPATGRILGQVSSAPIRDLLALALQDSDNALTEQLTRQAAFRAGAGTEMDDVIDWVLEAVAAEYNIDVSDVALADASGLSDGSSLPVHVVAELLATADNHHPQLQDIFAALPVAGHTGTVHDRFHLEIHAAAVGVARAKTGSLPGISGLGGYLVTADGRLLAYVVVADEVGPDGAVLEARSVLDHLVADLAECGC